jgi:diguanylate cyclase (GGDEF)-like protein
MALNLLEQLPASVHLPSNRWLSDAPPESAKPCAAFGAQALGLFRFVFDFVLVIVICCFDYLTGPSLSFAIFYVVPVALGAWRGNFAYGILLSLAGTACWYQVNEIESAGLGVYVRLWNGIVLFSFLVITASLLTRLRASIVHERALARTDPLTGVANGRIFFEVAYKEIDRAKRTGRALSIAYIDLDNFKTVNDQFGHATGDKLLKEVAQSLCNDTRLSDTVARLGGDEFAILLPDTAPPGAAAVLSRLRTRLLQLMNERNWPVTFSIGAATFTRPPGDVDVMIRIVDALMYAVKKNGKNWIRHEVIEDASSLVSEQKLERRASVRPLVRPMARISVEGLQQADEQFGKVQEITASDVRLQLDCQLKTDMLLTIEPLCAPRVRTLLAKVMDTSQEGDSWVYGCELCHQLSSAELQDWLES